MISLYGDDDDAEDKQIEMNEQFAISQNVSILAPRRSVNIYLVHQNMFLYFLWSRDEVRSVSHSITLHREPNEKEFTD